MSTDRCMTLGRQEAPSSPLARHRTRAAICRRRRRLGRPASPPGPQFRPRALLAAPAHAPSTKRTAAPSTKQDTKQHEAARSRAKQLNPAQSGTKHQCQHQNQRQRTAPAPATVTEPAQLLQQQRHWHRRRIHKFKLRSARPEPDHAAMDSSRTCWLHVRVFSALLRDRISCLAIGDR